ncbi:DeoR family transcriptional regulator [Pseudomonas aeruginosa]|uniref:DeoR family transcriptional regulator n=1 Tax=Pseudomonas aeruginosa TaxID=287 RepID=UPI0039B66476
MSGEVTVESLARRFSTSEVTTRTDHAAMEIHGRLLRRYGGAGPMPQERSGEAAQPVSPYKQASGRAAAARPIACL